MPAGRPTKYTDEMCNRVIEAGRDGASVAEMAVACDVAVATLYEWAGVHTGFSESFSAAQSFAEAYWAKLLKEGLQRPGSEYQGAANLKYMAQRFQERWSERRNVDLNANLRVEEVRRTIVDPEAN